MGEKANCRKHVICWFSFCVYTFFANHFFFFNTTDLLIIQKFNLTLEKLTIKTCMPDRFTQYSYTFQMVPKCKRYSKVSVPWMTPTRSITIEIKLHYSICIGITVQEIGFVQPTEENMQGELITAFQCLQRSSYRESRGTPFTRMHSDPSRGKSRSCFREIVSGYKKKKMLYWEKKQMLEQVGWRSSGTSHLKYSWPGLTRPWITSYEAQLPQVWTRAYPTQNSL